MCTDAFWTFVNDHINDDPMKLRLKFHNKDSHGFDVDMAITQIECRRKFGKKLNDTLSKHPRWLFPSLLAGEQSTSDRLAQFHASLLDDAGKVVDLTAGLGIDVLHISSKVASTTAIEIDELKAEALKYNFRDTDVLVVNDDCRLYIDGDVKFDTAFIDPARRAADGSRVYALSQCQPDIVAMLPRLSQVTSRLIVKMSPMLDITNTFRELPDAVRIIALGTETECKELIAIVDFSSEHSDTKQIESVTLKNDGSEARIEFIVDNELSLDTSSLIEKPKEGDFLYDPYPSVMKAGPYRLLAHRYGVKKIAANTHLYTLNAKVEDFPGQIFKIERIIPYNSKYIKRLKKDFPKIGVTTRNFDVSADSLRSKLGVADSDSQRLFAVTLSTGEKVMLITTHQR